MTTDKHLMLSITWNDEIADVVITGLDENFYLPDQPYFRLLDLAAEVEIGTGFQQQVKDLLIQVIEEL